MSSWTSVLLWLAITIGSTAFNFAVTYLAGGWSMIQRDLPILVREGVFGVVGATVGIGIAVVVGPFVTVALVLGGFVVLCLGFWVWRRGHPPAPLSERMLARRAALNSPKGLLLRRGFLAFVVIYGLVLGLIDGWTSG